MDAANIKDPKKAGKLLETTGWDIKTAIIIAACKIEVDAAERLLAENGGFVRKSLEAAEKMLNEGEK